MAYDHSSIHYTDPGTQVPSHNNLFDSQTYRQGERSDVHHGSTMSDPNRYAPPNKVDEAVTSAFDRAGAETQNYASPELIAQITQNVIRQLQSSALDGTTPAPPQSHFSTPPPPPPPIQQPVPLSPSTASGASTNMPNRVYTPPSPQKHPDYPLHPSPESHTRYMPDGLQSPTQSRAAQSQFSPPRRSSSPQSQASDAAAAEKPVRPKGPSRLSTSKEETTLERIWGQLFDEEGNSTVRLSQFLRGLAVHIIEDYEPRNSIVITPNKMQKYYEEVKLANELYPWSIIFDDERSSISRMYRDLACQHHLVQDKFDERPDIPGLTPVGFERWVTLLIQAHPEEEFERLQKAVLEMPISNPDDKKERFPKEISRRLFPGHGDDKVRDRIEESIQEHAAVEIPRRTSREEPKPQQDSHTPRSSVSEPPPYVPQNHRPSVSFDVPSTTNNSTSAYVPSHLERERKPYSNIPAECAIDDTNPPMAPPAANPIERERKPYSAMPGGGKQYEDENKRDNTKSRSDSSAPKPSRADSTARTRPTIVPQSRPMEVPKSDIPRPHRAPSNAGRRRRSPSFSRGSTSFRQSDGDLGRYPPSSYQPPSSLPPNGPPPFEGIYDEADTRRHFEKNARERMERDRARKQAEDDSRMYGESPRRYDRAGLDDRPPPRRNDYQNEEDYYKASGRAGSSGYENFQPYGGGPIYR